MKYPVKPRALKGLPRVLSWVLFFLFAFPRWSPGSQSGQRLQMPEGGPGIGFDDLGFAKGLGRVLVPAARSGMLDLVDPVTRGIISIRGFSSMSAYAGGHEQGVTSADEAGKLILASDRTSRRLAVVDPARLEIVARSALSDSPDYVRFVSTGREAWVTEPDAARIEVFSIPDQAPWQPVRKLRISVPGGPESLIIDEARGRAYVNLWKGSTAEIGLKEHRMIRRWPNGCAASRGLALDGRRGLLFAGCAEGKVVVMDLKHGGAVLSSLKSGAGVDVISYNAGLKHLYVPGARSESLAVVEVSDPRRPQVLATLATAPGAHCVAADDRDGIWVCDPKSGMLLYYRDSFQLPRAGR